MENTRSAVDLPTEQLQEIHGHSWMKKYEHSYWKIYAHSMPMHSWWEKYS